MVEILPGCRPHKGSVQSENSTGLELIHLELIVCPSFTRGRVLYVAGFHIASINIITLLIEINTEMNPQNESHKHISSKRKKIYSVNKSK